MTEKETIELVKTGKPFDGMTGIQVLGVQVNPNDRARSSGEFRPDLVIDLDIAGSRISVSGEVKVLTTPKIVEQLGLWIARLKSSNEGQTWALICPYLSPESQKYCQENNIDFIDLSGNVLLRIPGRLFIERLNRPNLFKTEQIYRNPFGGASSRVLRVLLQDPKRRWGVTDIKSELERESIQQNRENSFSLSIGSISKTIKSLEEELLVRRDGLKIIVPDPKRLLFRWAEKYRERYKWMRRSSWICANPLDFKFEPSVKKLVERYNLNAVLTGSAAANLIAPFINVDRIDLYLVQEDKDNELRVLNNEQGIGPDFVIFYPYDAGIAMYARVINGIKVASDIQIHLDCYARGGRDAKQAEYLLSNAIEKQWQMR